MSTDPAPTSTGLAPNVSMGLSWLFGFIFFFIEKNHQPSRTWAKQSLVVLAFSIVWQIVVGILVRLPAIGWIFALLSIPISLAILVFVVYGAIQAFTGKEWDIPVVGGLARQYLPKD